MLKVTIDITPEEVRELERDRVRRILIKEAGLGAARLLAKDAMSTVLEDTILLRVIDAALSIMGEE